jgi:hypothetical protein
MFSDSLVTPVRIEILLDLLRKYSRREWTRADLYKTLQPEALPAQQGKPDKSLAAKATIGAAAELDLIEENGRSIRAKISSRDSRTSREIVLDAFDQLVLGGTSIEPWFAPFYGYLLGLGPAGARTRSSDSWASAFVTEVLHNRRETNPFNGDKHGKIVQRWYPYTGLGWRDPSGIFHANPFHRLVRSIPRLFIQKAKQTSDEFMESLAEVCPELDGGAIFRESNANWTPASKTCSLGLSHALVDMHLDGYIELTGGKDSRGWSVDSASPPRKGFWGKFDFIELVSRREGIR